MSRHARSTEAAAWRPAQKQTWRRLCVNGRKRHIAVDTTGLLLAVVITAASVQDRDGGRPLLWNLRRACGKVLLVWAGGRIRHRQAGHLGRRADDDRAGRRQARPVRL